MSIKLEYTTKLKLILTETEDTHGMDFNVTGNLDFTKEQVKSLRDIVIQALSKKIGYSERDTDELIAFIDENSDVTKLTVKKN